MKHSEGVSKMSRIGILTVATNRYIEYWEKMVISFSESVSNHDLTFHVFTDQISRVQKFSDLNSNINVRVHKVEPLGWPSASLYRYRLISSISDLLGEDVLMHLDADMLVLRSFDSQFDPSTWEGGVSLVAHPGFWRPSGRAAVRFYRDNPRRIAADLSSKIRIGGLGAWCQNRNSEAYVPRKSRKVYVCGGTWMGMNREFKALSQTLAQSVSVDEIEGVMAEWHDESHLNKWAVMNRHSVLSPSYCFDPSYPQLADLEEIIRAVDKNESA
jgi:hypothetical protein